MCARCSSTAPIGTSELDFRAAGHLSTRDLVAVLERTCDRVEKHLRRHGLLEDGDAADEGGSMAVLAASAVVHYSVTDEIPAEYQHVATADSKSQARADGSAGPSVPHFAQPPR
jgi:hypothetical protein